MTDCVKARRYLGQRYILQSLAEVFRGLVSELMKTRRADKEPTLSGRRVMPGGRLLTTVLVSVVVLDSQ